MNQLIPYDHPEKYGVACMSNEDAIHLQNVHRELIKRCVDADHESGRRFTAPPTPSLWRRIIDSIRGASR